MDNLNGKLSQGGDEAGFNEELTLEWNRVIDNWSNFKTRQNDHVRDLVRRGVPSYLRARIWKLLANAQQVTPETSEQYRTLLSNSSDCEKMIKRDKDRTYPENDYFKDETGPGQEGLFNVIKAYSLHDKEVGYCQGSAFIVGLLLLQLSEEESFMIFCKIMQDYRMREIYKPTMAELGLCIYQLECLVQEQLPELYVHFQSQNFHTSMYSTSWFLTLFTSNLPLHLSYRVMDLFLSEGLEIIFRLSMAILQICKVELLKLDMEALLKYFQKEMPSRIDCDPDYLIKCACLIKYDGKKMKKLCKDYTTIKTKEQEEAVEFRRLRNENRLLLERIRALELENKELAGTLIVGQVNRAQEAEDNFLIKRELSRMKNSDEENKIIISKLQSQIAELEKLLADRTMIFSNESKTVISDLMLELDAVKIAKAENDVEIDQLNKKITEQELYIKSLRENVPEDPIAQLQEELGFVKLREAEANLTMKELKTKLTELQNLWLEHLQQVHGIVTSSSQPNSLDQSTNSSPGSVVVSGQTSSLTNGNAQQSLNSVQASQPSSLSSAIVSSNPLGKFFSSSMMKRSSGSTSGDSNSGHVSDEQEIQRLKQELFTLKLHEAELSTEVKQLRSREMELETQIKLQENRFKRKEDELKRIEETLNGESTELIEVKNQLRDVRSRKMLLEAEINELKMSRRIRDVEHTTTIGELKQKVSSLESKIEEINALRKLAESGIEPKDASEYQERVAELQSESFRLDAHNKKLQDLERKNSEREREGEGNIRGE